MAAHEEMFGLKQNGLPVPNVYGERQNIANRYRNVFAIFMNNARRALSMPRSATAADAGVL